jgi:nicotinamidase-related amidase
MSDDIAEAKSWFTAADLDIKIKETAYLSMDLSVGALKGKRSKMSTLGQHCREQNVLLNCQKTLEASRTAGMFVVHIRVAFRPGYPEYGKVCSHFWAKIRENGVYIDGTPDAELCEEVAPKENEPIITKHTVDPFIYSDLDKLLHSRGIKYLVLTGVTTSNVIEGTVRAGTDRGYVTIALEDCVADYNEEMHKFQFKQLLPMLSIVSNSSKYFEALEKEKK